MPTTVVNKNADSIVVRNEQKVNFAKDVSTNGFTRADAAYFGSPSAFLPTGIVTVAPGLNTFSGTDETNFLAWLAANPTSPLIASLTIYGAISTPTIMSPQTFQVVT